MDVEDGTHDVKIAAPRNRELNEETTNMSSGSATLPLIYAVDDRPPWGLSFLLGLQVSNWTIIGIIINLSRLFNLIQFLITNF